MLHFYPVTIIEISKELPDCISVLFDVPSSLHEIFKYKAGQYLTLKTHIDGEEVRRNYSLCSSPLENEWRVAIKKVEGGLFSTFANEQLKPGDIIEVMPPMGSFHTEIKDGNKKNYVAIAAGSGITPVLSIIKTVLKKEKESSCTLVYGNRTHQSIIFKEELEGLKNMYMDRFRIIHILSREITDATINSGRIDAGKCESLFTKFLSLNADEFFICGPESMIFCVKDFLIAKGVERNKIHFELFTVPGHKTSHIEHKIVVHPEGPKSKITIIQDGRTFDFELAFDDQNILDAALHYGADLPYSCKGGVCSTCRARLMHGEVEMEANYALEPDEVKAGIILTCQSHPKSEKVVVNFDAK
ncbi:MAG: phenylacetate-CoA oxygenase/reductase, PaaK subunit [Chitinophagaceae bacterium]|nr:phenylacetate-CoA oxygenase/reductase, PaaK subunit [Chitinophagaceae bacterium]